MANSRSGFWLGIYLLWTEHENFAKEVSELNSDSVAHIVKAEQSIPIVFLPRASDKKIVTGGVVKKTQVGNSAEKEEIIAYIKKVFGKNASLMLRVAECESNTRQFDFYGNVLRGKVNSKDVGIFQVNEKYHLADSVKLGMDIYTIKGNVDYGYYLFSRNWTRDWKWSSGCWNY